LIFAIYKDKFQLTYLTALSNVYNIRHFVAIYLEIA
jgi:hypothetical protein